MNAADTDDNACNKDPPATSKTQLGVRTQTNVKERKTKPYSVQRCNTVEHQQRGGRAESEDKKNRASVEDKNGASVPAAQSDHQYGASATQRPPPKLPNFVAPTTTPETAMPSPVKPSRLLYGDDGDDGGNQQTRKATCATKLLDMLYKVDQDNVQKITIVLTLEEYNKLLQVMEEYTDTNLVDRNENTHTTLIDTNENAPPQRSTVSPCPTTKNFPKFNQPTLELQFNAFEYKSGGKKRVSRPVSRTAKNKAISSIIIQFKGPATKTSKPLLYTRHWCIQKSKISLLQLAADRKTCWGRYCTFSNRSKHL
jgi:hypothetical protein